MSDAPADLVAAVEHAMTILNWQENLLPDETPPRWMWHLDDELELWFENVDDQRKAKYGGSDDSGEEWASMERNELAIGKR